MLERQRTVAIVDDDLSMLRATESLLDAHRLATKVYSSGEEFLASGSAAQVDCVVLDIHLGGMSGIELRRRLALSRPALPVIFMTGHDDESTSQAVERVGCAVFLRKPYSACELIDAIEEAVPRLKSL